jgi:hypothetical protein
MQGAPDHRIARCCRNSVQQYAIVDSSDIPKLKMSAFSVHFSFVSTSGAAHANVPAERGLHQHHASQLTAAAQVWLAHVTVLPSENAADCLMQGQSETRCLAAQMAGCLPMTETCVM